MKTRQGFVSNSSSSSFVCWGIHKDNIAFSDEAYLREFENRLNCLEQKRAKSPEHFWHRATYAEMLECKTDEQKIEYIRDWIESDPYDFFEESSIFSIGGPEHDFVGITPTWMCKTFPEVKFGEIEKFVAEQFNKNFGTNFSANDITYYEEGWYDG